MGRMILAGFGALLVTGVATFALLTAFNVDVLDEGTAQEEVELPGGPAGGLLLWNTRDKVAICIDVAGEASLRADTSELRARSTDAVTDAMADLVEHPVWLTTESVSKADIDVIVDPDCPREAKMQCPENPGLPAISCASSLVSEPSPYRLFVFVVSEADLQRVTGGMVGRLTTLEHVCSGGDLCSEVTTATWVSEVEAADRGALNQLIAEALGLSKPRRG